MKRWHIVLIVVAILGLLGGLELKLYLRQHPRFAKKIIVLPRTAKKATIKKSKQVKYVVVQFGRTTKKQYVSAVKKATEVKRSLPLKKAGLIAGGVVGAILGGLLLVVIFRLLAGWLRKARPARLLSTPSNALDSDIPPLPEHKDPEIHADKVAEVLQARRNLQAKREGKLPPLSEQQIKKYELTDMIVNYEGRILRRIRALLRIQNTDGDVIADQGELGGYIEHEVNLSHYRNAWVGEQAMVFGNAKVYGDAIVAGQAKVFDKARIYDLARVDGAALVGGTAEICGKAHLSQGTYTEGKKS